MSLQNSCESITNQCAVSAILCLLLSVSLFVTGCGSSGTATGPPHSTTIAFASTRALDGSDAANTGPAANIWTMNADSSGQVPLTRLTNGLGAFNAVWSPDGHKLAFLSDRALDGTNTLNTNRTINLWVMNADGSAAVPVTTLTASFADVGNSAADNPAWSPDGRRLAYNSFRALDGSDGRNLFNHQNIWVVNADGSGSVPLTRLTALSTDSVEPAWSPDGRKLAFASSRAFDGSDAPNRNATGNIWLMNADGSGATALTRIDAAFLASSGNPLWSSDGRRIAFESQRDLDGSNAGGLVSNIWVMNADGSGATPLTRLASASISGPAWSPNGNKLAYFSNRALDGSDGIDVSLSDQADVEVSGNPPVKSDTDNIWVINADGSGSAPLTRLTNTMDSVDPAWASDGSRLAFARGNIWVMNADGSGAVQLTKLTAAVRCSSPKWHP